MNLNVRTPQPNVTENIENFMILTKTVDIICLGENIWFSSGIAVDKILGTNFPYHVYWNVFGLLFEF